MFGTEEAVEVGGTGGPGTKSVRGGHVYVWIVFVPRMRASKGAGWRCSGPKLIDSVCDVLVDEVGRDVRGPGCGR